MQDAGDEEDAPQGKIGIDFIIITEHLDGFCHVQRLGHGSKFILSLIKGNLELRFWLIVGALCTVCGHGSSVNRNTTRQQLGLLIISNGHIGDFCQLENLSVLVK